MTCEFKESDMWSTLHITHMQFQRLRVPNLHPLIRSTINRFQDIAQFGIAPLTPMLKLQRATK